VSDRRLWGEPDEDQLDMWWVALEVPGDDDLNGGPWVRVAEAALYAMHPERQVLLGASPYGAADAHSSDTEMYYRSVFEYGWFREDVEEQFGWPLGQVVFLDDVTVPANLRGRELGSLLAADAILTFATCGTAMFAHPGPTEMASDVDGRFWKNTASTRFLARLGACAVP